MNDRPTPTSASLGELATSSAITAAFFTGATGLGHHWQLRSPAGDLLALTVRVHSGGKLAQKFWKMLSVTALDAGNDIHVELHGAEDRVLARISSINDNPAPVTVTDPAGAQRVRSLRDKDTLTVYGDDEQIVVELSCEGGSPWKVKDRTGFVVGELLAGAPGPSTKPSVAELVWDPRLAINTAAGAAGMHLGLRRVMQYTFAPEPASTPMPVGVALLPLLAGLTY